MSKLTEAEWEQRKEEARKINLTTIKYNNAKYYYEQLHQQMLRQYKHRFNQVYKEVLEEGDKKSARRAADAFNDILVGAIHNENAFSSKNVYDTARSSSSKMFDELEKLIEKLFDIYTGTASNAQIQQELKEAIEKFEDYEKQYADKGEEELEKSLKYAIRESINQTATKNTFSMIEKEVQSILRKQKYLFRNSSINDQNALSAMSKNVISTDNVQEIMAQALGYIRKKLIYKIKEQQESNSFYNSEEIKPLVWIAAGFFQESLLASAFRRELIKSSVNTNNLNTYFKDTLIREAGAKTDKRTGEKTPVDIIINLTDMVDSTSRLMSGFSAWTQMIDGYDEKNFSGKNSKPFIDSLFKKSTISPNQAMDWVFGIQNKSWGFGSNQGVRSIGQRSNLWSKYKAQISDKTYGTDGTKIAYGWKKAVQFLAITKHTIQTLGERNVMFTLRNERLWMYDFLEKIRKNQMYLAFTAEKGSSRLSSAVHVEGEKQPKEHKDK